MVNNYFCLTGNATVAVFWYIVLFIFEKVTFWDLLDMFRFKKLHVYYLLVIFGYIWSEKTIFAAGTVRPGRAAGTGGHGVGVLPDLEHYF